MGNCYDEHTKRNTVYPEESKQDEQHESGIRPYGGGGPEDPGNGSYQRDFTAGFFVAYLTKYTQELDEIVSEEKLFGSLPAFI